MIRIPALLGEAEQDYRLADEDPSFRFVTFHLLHLCGAIVHQTFNQLLPASDQTLADLATHKNNLGFHDIRNDPHSMRSERLSWEHHRMIAKLAPAQQERWIDQCHAQENDGTRMSTRRLHKSIALGRVATLDDMEPDPADRGIEEPHSVC